MTNSKAEEFRSSEFPQLKNRLYFDYAGAMPICQSQSNTYSSLSHSCFSNPHSASKHDESSANMHILRSLLCQTFKCTLCDYNVIFFQNTTHAIQTIGRLFKWSGGSFRYLIDDHNSILGLRQLAISNGATSECVSSLPTSLTPGGPNVFAYPMQSNFSGCYYPLSWIESFQALGGHVFLDAASSSAPDLSIYKPDFVFVSLLKLTGAHGGAVLIRRGQESLLIDPPPSGGTVLFSCARTGEYKSLPLVFQRLEAGTPSYIDAALAIAGLRTRRRFGDEDSIRSHLMSLSRKFESGLRALVHDNGKPLVEFQPERKEGFGSNFSFNLRNPDGTIIAHQDAQFTFDVWGVIVRLGGHCNPGAGFPALGWEPNEIEQLAKDNASKGKCLSNMCMIDKRAVGTIRVSFGYPTTEADVDKLLEIMRFHFLNRGPNPTVEPIKDTFIVSKLFVFPVVGMMGFSVDSWPLTTSGLVFDRSWKLCDDDGHVVTTTECPTLAKLFATVSIEKRTLCIKNCETHQTIEIPTDYDKIISDENAPAEVKKQGRVYGNGVSDFIMEATDRHMWLLRVNQRESGRFSMSCVTQESIDAVGGIDPLRLRSNVLLSGAPAFAEEGTMEKLFKFAGLPLTVWRWRIICMTTSVVPETGEIDTKALKQMSLKRGRSGIAPFGCLFSVDCGNKEYLVKVGDKLEP